MMFADPLELSGVLLSALFDDVLLSVDDRLAPSPVAEEDGGSDYQAGEKAGTSRRRLAYRCHLYGPPYRCLSLGNPQALANAQCEVDDDAQHREVIGTLFRPR